VERELLLLGLLRRQEMHGYRLVEMVERDLHSTTDLKKPTAYFLLNKMTRAGWVTRNRTRDGNRPPKWVYRITPQGEIRFQALLRQNLASFLPAKFAGDAGLAFLDVLEPGEVIELLTQRRAELERYLHEAEAAEPPGPMRLVTEHRRAHLRTELDWLEALIRQVRAEASGVVSPVGLQRTRL
jgi:DNA-binding PadR family transcriptional regulator